MGKRYIRILHYFCHFLCICNYGKIKIQSKKAYKKVGCQRVLFHIIPQSSMVTHFFIFLLKQSFTYKQPIYMIYTHTYHYLIYLKKYMNILLNNQLKSHYPNQKVLFNLHSHILKTVKLVHKIQARECTVSCNPISILPPGSHLVPFYSNYW